MNKKSCLPKHYWRPIAVMEVVDDLEPYTLPSKKFRTIWLIFYVEIEFENGKFEKFNAKFQIVC